MSRLGSAAGGALSGAAAGSVLGPWGAAGGAAIGGLAGALFGGGPDTITDPTGGRAQFSQYPDWGRDPAMADKFAGAGLDASNTNLGYESQGINQANTLRMPTVYENQDLSNREAEARGWDQSGALQLSREAAMGEAPSAAAYQLQSGLDQSLAAQQAQAGAARGSAGIALANSNAMANSAGLMGQASNQAAMLRAQEMASARGLYGGLAGQMREQDLSRLNMGNQIAGQNAQLGQQMQLGWLGAAPQFGGVGSNFYGQSMNPYNSQLGSDTAIAGGNLNSANQAAGRTIGVNQFNATQNSANRAQDLASVGTGFTSAGQALAATQKPPSYGGTTYPSGGSGLGGSNPYGQMSPRPSTTGQGNF